MRTPAVGKRKGGPGLWRQEEMEKQGSTGSQREAGSSERGDQLR